MSLFSVPTPYSHLHYERQSAVSALANSLRTIARNNISWNPMYNVAASVWKCLKFVRNFYTDSVGSALSLNIYRPRTLFAHYYHFYS